MDAFIKFWKNYANFNGRTSRGDFWNAYLINLLFFVSLELIMFVPYVYLIYNLFLIACLIPGIAIGFRRMHDVERPGWYFFIPIYGFILSTLSGDKRKNKYGQDPKLRESLE